ncbi:hypothetical protein [Curtobacterium ammoniigenes]|uniref:hypothetical protein n=1 Tax=Curtobacterium ammoniigenes TaxID=395387 RepID=UPI000829B75A|nr:hypothetical protein [Curtobacterium ammoniigenes]
MVQHRAAPLSIAMGRLLPSQDVALLTNKDVHMIIAAHRWNRATVLARLAAGDAIDRAAETDARAAARARLHVLNVSDRFEARAMTEQEAIDAFTLIEREARSIAEHAHAG